MFYLRFLHFLGLAMWIGGAIAAFTIARSISGSVGYRWMLDDQCGRMLRACTVSS